MSDKILRFFLLSKRVRTEKKKKGRSEKGSSKRNKSFIQNEIIFTLGGTKGLFSALAFGRGCRVAGIPEDHLRSGRHEEESSIDGVVSICLFAVDPGLFADSRPLET